MHDPIESADRRLEGYTFEGYSFDVDGPDDGGIVCRAWVRGTHPEADTTEIVGLDPRTLIRLRRGEAVTLTVRDDGQTSGVRTTSVVAIERDCAEEQMGRPACRFQPGDMVPRAFESSPVADQLRRGERAIVQGLNREGFGRQYQSTTTDGFSIAVDGLLITVKEMPPLEEARKPPAALTDAIKALPRVDKL